MKYMLLIYMGENAMNESEREHCYADSIKLTHELQAGGKYLGASRGLPSVEIKTPYHSTWLDNTKAKLLLGWRPEYDMQKMINSAFDYVRPARSPRKVWYPG